MNSFKSISQIPASSLETSIDDDFGFQIYIVDSTKTSRVRFHGGFTFQIYIVDSGFDVHKGGFVSARSFQIYIVDSLLQPRLQSPRGPQLPFKSISQIHTLPKSWTLATSPGAFQIYIVDSSSHIISYAYRLIIDLSNLYRRFRHFFLTTSEILRLHFQIYIVDSAQAPW